MIRRRILVPIDFRPHSDAALNYAMKISAKSGDMISCMYVMEDSEIITDNPASNELKRKMRLDAEFKLSERVHSILKSDDSISFELIVSSGKVHEKILEKAFDLNARIIVMGKSNSWLVENKRIGSNMKYILTHALIPVIAVSDTRISEKNYLIVALDLSKPVDILIKCAIDSVRLLDAGIILISVMEKEMVIFEPIYRSRLKEIRKLLRAYNIKCNSHIIFAQKSVSEEIIAFSNRIDSAVILLMTGMEGDDCNANIDSNTLEVIANSKVPIQCINPKYTPNLMIDEASRTNLPESFSCSL